MKKGNLTILLILANAAVLLLMFMQGDGETFTRANRIVMEGLKSNHAIQSGQWYRLFTSMFIHLSIIHILMNMYILWDLGSLVELAWGKVSYFVIYFGGGLMGSLASFAFSPNDSAGASGAVFAVAGALLAARYLAADHDIPFPKQALGSIGIFVAFNIFFGMRSGSGIDNAAHIGGLIGGALLGFALLRSRSLLMRVVLIGGTGGGMYWLYMKGMAL